MIGAGGRDDGEFVAAEPGDDVVGAQRAREPLGDAADQLVADRMAERVVDILEVIEVDIEDRGRRASASHFGDRHLEPFAEEDAVGQPAQRVVQREMAQPGLAGRDGRCGAPHVAEDDARQQRKSSERNRDERNDAVDDLGRRVAWASRRSGRWIGHAGR